MCETYKYSDVLDIDFLLEQNKKSISEDEKLNIKTNN